MVRRRRLVTVGEAPIEHGKNKGLLTCFLDFTNDSYQK